MPGFMADASLYSSSEPFYRISGTLESPGDPWQVISQTISLRCFRICLMQGRTIYDCLVACGFDPANRALQV
jgi:hypothetical protein